VAHCRFPCSYNTRMSQTDAWSPWKLSANPYYPSMCFSLYTLYVREQKKNYTSCNHPLYRMSHLVTPRRVRNTLLQSLQFEYDDFYIHSKKPYDCITKNFNDKYIRYKLFLFISFVHSFEVKHRVKPSKETCLI